LTGIVALVSFIVDNELARVRHLTCWNHVAKFPGTCRFP